MERRQDLQQILFRHAEAQEKTVEELKGLLRKRTERASELGLFEGIAEKQLPGVQISQEVREKILLATNPLEGKEDGAARKSRHMVLLTDGGLYNLEVRDESGFDEHRISKTGSLQEEITTQEYLDRAPLFIKEIENLILEPNKEK